MKKRVLSLLLAVCLVLGSLPLPALATEVPDAPPASATDVAENAPVVPEEEKETPAVPDEQKDEEPIAEEPADEKPVEEEPIDEEPIDEEETADEEGIAPQAEDGETACLTVLGDAPTEDSTTAGDLYELDLDEVFSDTEDHTLSYSFETSVENEQIKIKEGTFYFSTSEAGEYDVTLKATCAEGTSVSHVLTITVEAAKEGIDAQYGYNETAASSVTVYVTLSNDGMPVLAADGGTVLSHLKVTVPYFDLEPYGLDSYNRCGTENGKGPYTDETVIQRPTGLHLYIYLLERYYMGLPESACCQGTSGVLDYDTDTSVRYMDGAIAYESDGLQALTITGNATSLYMVNFWGHDENLMYFRNHCYPYMSAGWGATSDYILLSDGDTWDVAMFTNWNFYSSGGFFARFDKDAYTVEAGKDLTVSTLKWGTTSAATDFSAITGLTVGLYDSDWNKVQDLTYTTGNSLTFTAPEKAGDYYLMALDPDAMDGEDAKGAPATARITVTAAEKEPEAVASGECGESLTWKLTADGVLTISGTGAMTDFGGTVNPPWDSYKDQITSVSVAEGVTSIGATAFYGYSKLTTVAIPGTVKTIGNAAFFRSGLTKLEIPAGVETIGSSAFKYCSSLTEVTIGNTVTNIYASAFGFCTSLKELVMPNSVTTLGGGVVEGCSGLTKLTLSNNITSLNNGDLDCQAPGLTSITIPASVTSIKNNAFATIGAENYWTEITFLGTMPEMEKFALRNLTATIHCPCSWDKELCTETAYNATALTWDFAEHNYEDGKCTVCGATDPDSPLASGKFGEDDCLSWVLSTDGKLTISGNGKFPESFFDIPWRDDYKKQIKSVVIEDGTTVLQGCAFDGCTNLETVSIPDSVTVIGSSTFLDCENLQAVTIPENVTTIGANAFKNCKKLQNVTIPGKVTEIGYHAFRGCTGLTSMVIPDNVTNLEQYAFYGCSNLASVTLSKNLEKLSDSTFAYCTALTSIEIPDKVTKIWNNVFEGSGLESIVIGDNVTYMGAEIFNDCTKLKSAIIGKNVASMNWKEFGGCTALEEVHFKGSAPSFNSPSFFKNVTATVYYPCNDESWTEEICTATFGDATALTWTVEHSGTGRKCDVCGAVINNTKPTLIEGVTDVVAKVQTNHAYQLKDLENGKIFEDADGDKLNYASYFYKKSSDGGKTWSEMEHFTASLFGGNDMTFTNSKEGNYLYKFWAYDGYEYSDDTWTLTLIVMDVVPADINFYVGYDQNYVKDDATYKYPVLELYRTAGIDDDFNDFIGWFTDAEGETVRIYDPHKYTIAVDGEKTYVELGESRYELQGYEKLTLTNSSFYDADENATPSNTVVSNYNMFYVSLETGRYSTRFYGYNSETEAYDVYLGGQSMALPMEQDIYGGGGNNLYFRVVSIYTNSKKTDGNYFTADDYDAQISMPITGSNIQHGDPYVAKGQTYYPFMSWANGNGSVYAAYVYPYDTDNYVFSQAINQTTAAGYSVVTKNMTISTALALTVTVPEDGNFGLYFQYNNFNTKEIEPRTDAVSNGDGTKTLTYLVSKGSGNYTWRLEDPTGAHVTKGGWLKQLTAATEMTITYSGETNSKSHDFSGLGTTVATRDEADIQVFASHSGFLSISGTQRIRAFRMWELINSDTANIMVEPDYNVQFLQGNSSDLVQVDGGNGGGNWLDVTPTGTDIIAVSYDAIDMYADNNTHSTHGGFFPATNPERTAVMVVTNGTAGTADATISFNGSLNTNRGTEWDYNYDTWFYMDTDEAPTLDFTVSGNGNVSVSYANVTTNSSLVSTLSDWYTVTADEDGYYHTDLLAFRNAGTLGGTVIIKMTDSTGTSYRLARVAEMSVTVTNMDYPGEMPTPGSKVKLTFDGLYRSVNKISGVFNPTVYYLRYTQDGTEINGQLGQYQQMDRASITLTIPEEVERDEDGKASYTFTNGYIYGQMYSAVSPFDTMYQMTDTGMGTNFSAASINFVLSRLADVTVEVATMSTYDIQVDITEGGKALDGCTFTLVSPEGETLTPDENGVYRELPWGVYTYSISKSGYIYQTGTQTVGSDYEQKKDENGLVHWTFAMVKGAEGCWDGTKSEPAKVDDVYQIGTGAELAWFADHVNSGNGSASAVLTADIDLAQFPWTTIGNSQAKFSGSFDGQNHTISNLVTHYSATTTTAPYLGLFGYVDGTSKEPAEDGSTAPAVVKDLTVKGEITMTSTGNVSNAYSGGIVGYAKHATLENLHNQVNLTVKRVNGNWQYVGGIVGYATDVTISDCGNTGKIYGYNYAGGIAGYVLGASTVVNCSNTATIQANSNAGGIAGNALGSASISKCYNIGSISTYASNYAGGIVGNLTGTAVITSCYNTANITSASGNAGGIAGQSRGTITACYNLGNITAQNYAGGIVGQSSNATVTNTYNTGKVKCDGNYTGGVAGYATTSATAGSVDRNYYLETTCSVGIGYTGYSLNNTVLPATFTQSDLTSEEFVALLNAELEEEAFGLGAEHPLLLWQDGVIKKVPGDLNGDNLINMEDVSILLGVVNGGEILEVECDLNDDGLINMEDVAFLLQQVNTSAE